MYRRPRNRVARDIAERLIARRLVRQLMIEYEYLSGVANRPWCWLLGHEGPERRGYIRCDQCGQKCGPEILLESRRMAPDGLAKPF
jgi:hypothetical protein